MSLFRDIKLKTKKAEQYAHFVCHRLNLMSAFLKRKLLFLDLNIRKQKLRLFKDLLGEHVNTECRMCARFHMLCLSTQKRATNKDLFDRTEKEITDKSASH